MTVNLLSRDSYLPDHKLLLGKMISTNRQLIDRKQHLKLIIEWIKLMGT
jgi:hypothetical protein